MTEEEERTERSINYEASLGQARSEGAACDHVGGMSLPNIQPRAIAIEHDKPATFLSPSNFFECDFSWKLEKELQLKDTCTGCMVINDTVYVAQKQGVYKYPSSMDKPMYIPANGIKNFSLGKLRDRIITVGGYDLENGKSTAKVYIYDPIQKTWGDQEIPDMLTPRCSPSIACTSNYIVASGGWIDDDKSNACESIEIYNVNEDKWQVAPSLPFEGPAGTVLLQDQCFVIVYHAMVACSEDEKLQESGSIGENHNAHSNGLCAVANLQYLLRQTNMNEHAPAPIIGTTKVVEKPPNTASCDLWHISMSIPNKLMIAPWKDYIIGFNGKDVYMFAPSINEWSHVSSLSFDVPSCAFIAVLPNDKFMLIGGENKLKSIEVFGRI